MNNSVTPYHYFCYALHLINGSLSNPFNSLTLTQFFQKVQKKSLLAPRLQEIGCDQLAVVNI